MSGAFRNEGLSPLCLCLCPGKVVKLSLAAEEVALFFAQMLDHEYTTKDVFRENFFKDWRKVASQKHTWSLNRRPLHSSWEGNGK